MLAFDVCYAVIPFTGVFTDVGTPSAASAIAAVCAGAFRGRAVPLGPGIAGLPLGLLTLGNFFLPMAGITLWFAAASIALAATRRPSAAAAVPAPRAAVPTTV